MTKTGAGRVCRSIVLVSVPREQPNNLTARFFRRGRERRFDWLSGVRGLSSRCSQALYQIVEVQNKEYREKNGEDQPECLLELGQLRLQSVPSVAKIVFSLGHPGDPPIETVLDLVAPHQLEDDLDREIPRVSE